MNSYHISGVLRCSVIKRTDFETKSIQLWKEMQKRAVQTNSGPVQRDPESHRLGETSETTLSRWAWTMHFSAVKLQPLITVWPHRFLLERFAHVLPAVQSLVPPQPEDPSLSLSLSLPPLHLHGTPKDGPRHPSLRLWAASGLGSGAHPSNINTDCVHTAHFFPLSVFFYAFQPLTFPLRPLQENEMKKTEQEKKPKRSP